jgi:hypothetical protein
MGEGRMTKLYINIGYHQPTRMAVIAGNDLKETVHLLPETELSDIVNVTTVLCMRFKISTMDIVTKNPSTVRTLIEQVRRNLGEE